MYDGAVAEVVGEAFVKAAIGGHRLTMQIFVKPVVTGNKFFDFAPAQIQRIRPVSPETVMRKVPIVECRSLPLHADKSAEGREVFIRGVGEIIVTSQYVRRARIRQKITDLTICRCPLGKDFVETQMWRAAPSRFYIPTRMSDQMDKPHIDIGAPEKFHAPLDTLGAIDQDVPVAACCGKMKGVLAGHRFDAVQDRALRPSVSLAKAARATPGPAPRPMIFTKIV